MSIVLGANQYGKSENRVVRDLPRHRPARDPRPQRLDLAARRLRGRAHQRRPGQRAADRHPEEHRLRLRQGARRHLARGLRDRPGHALPRGRPAGDRRAGAGRGVRLGPDPGRRRGPRPLLRPARDRDPDRLGHRRGPRRRAAGLGGLGLLGPRRAQVHRLGVQGLPQGRLHHAAGDRRPDHGDLADRLLAPRGHRGRARHRLGRALRARSRRSLLAGFATTYSRALQETLYAMGSAVLENHPERGRDQVLGAQQAPLPGRPRPRSAWRTTARSSSPPTGPTG